MESGIASPRESERPEDSCPQGKCDGSGWLLDDAGSTPCPCREERLARQRSRGLRRSVPPEFQGLGFDRHPINNLDPELLHVLKTYSRNISRHFEKGEGLGFFGPPGTGKTTLGYFITQLAREAGYTVAIYNTPTLIAKLREASRPESPTDAFSLIERLAEVDYLFLDELAVARPTEFVLEQLYVLVNMRWEENKPFVFTADVEEPTQLEERVTRRTLSRLAHRTIMVPVMGKDRRLTG